MSYCRVLLVVLAVALLVASPVAAQQDAPSQTLFTNVNIFDGTSDNLQMGMNVLVEGNLIGAISSSAISASGATVIDGAGRTLMPGLIDNHTHLGLNGASLLDMEANMTWEDLAIGQVPLAARVTY